MRIQLPALLSLLSLAALTGCGGNSSAPYVSDIQASQLAYGQAFSTRLAEQLKANDHSVSATYIARQIHVTPHAARLWLMGLNIPKEQNMQVLAKWLKVEPGWLLYGGLKKDSFVADYMSLSEEATVRAVVGVFGRA